MSSPSSSTSPVQHESPLRRITRPEVAPHTRYRFSAQNRRAHFTYNFYTTKVPGKKYAHTAAHPFTDSRLHNRTTERRADGAGCKERRRELSASSCCTLPLACLPIQQHTTASARNNDSRHPHSYTAGVRADIPPIQRAKQASALRIQLLRDKSSQQEVRAHRRTLLQISACMIERRTGGAGRKERGRESPVKLGTRTSTSTPPVRHAITTAAICRVTRSESRSHVADSARTTGEPTPHTISTQQKFPARSAPIPRHTLLRIPTCKGKVVHRAVLAE